MGVSSVLGRSDFMVLSPKPEAQNSQFLVLNSAFRGPALAFRLSFATCSELAKKHRRLNFFLWPFVLSVPSSWMAAG